MSPVQTRLELPIRKTRTRAGKSVEPVVVEDVSGGEDTSVGRATRSKKLIATIEDPESLCRTPRSKKKPATKKGSSEANTAVKRCGSEKTDLETETEVSPSKIARTPLKSINSEKENVPKPSPSNALGQLSLSSPRPGRGRKENQAVAASSLFTSPLKPLSVAAVQDLLFDSPEKARCSAATRRSLVPEPRRQLQSTRSPARQPQPSCSSPGRARRSDLSPARQHAPAPTALFLSPSKPAARSRTPAKSPARQSLLPTPNKSLYPSKSPLKLTSSQLENILCSPVKSPARSPRKPITPAKLGSVQRTALFSPVKAAPAPIPSPAPRFTADVSQFQSARAALHTGRPSALLCREEQVGVMSDWLDRHLVATSPGSMYVSGAPGTGKTATLTHLLDTKTAKYEFIFINCMVLKSSIAIYREVAKKLNPKKEPKTEKDALKVIEAAITSGGCMKLLVLDEIDQLDSKNQAVLYTVFEWPALQGSRLALVGIANSLDLTDRVLPRLQVCPAYQPTLLHYPPYTKQQIIDILTARLKDGGQAESAAVITPRAIAFLAGKIASLSGDLRKALDVCRRALELSETLARKQNLLKPMTPRGLASPTKSPRKGYLAPKPVPQIGQVDLPQIMKVINQVYGSQVTASLGTKGEGIPMKQKLLIASLLLMVKKGRSKEVTLGKLSETFSKILRKRQMEPEHESACVGEKLRNYFVVCY